MTTADWVAELLDWIEEVDDANPYFEGPITVVATGEVYPGDLSPQLPAEQVGRRLVPDVGVVLCGSFTPMLNNPEGVSYACQLLVADRTSPRSGYYAEYSNDANELVDRLP